MKFLVWLIGSVVLAFGLSELTKGERRNYDAVIAAWGDPSANFASVESKCLAVSSRTTDGQLQFVAKYLANYASVLRAAGYENVGAALTSSAPEALGRGFLLGFSNPGSVFKTVPLWWNSSRFEKEGAELDRRYGTTRYYLVLFGALLSAILTYALFGLRGREARGLQLAPARPLIVVTPDRS